MKKIRIMDHTGKLLYELEVDETDKKFLRKCTEIVRRLRVEKIKYNAGIVMKNQAKKPLSQIRRDVRTVENCIRQIDTLFGRDFVKCVFAKQYEEDEDFLPGYEVLLDVMQRTSAEIERVMKAG